MLKITTFSEFEKQIDDKYDGKFTIEPFIYKNLRTLIRVKCPEHGWFDTTPKQMRDTIFGCRKCSLVLGNRVVPWKIIKQEIIAKYGNEFDLSRAGYTTKMGKITIGCPNHGWIETSPHRMLTNQFGCERCSPYGTRTLDDFIQLCIDKFGDIYDFSRSVYNGRKNMIIIGCPNHGFQEYKADLFIESKGGCGLCGYESKRVGTAQFKNDIIDKFGDIFDLSRIEYIDRKTPAMIGCSKHGWQETKPRDFMKNKYGCGVCGHEAKTFTTPEWETISRSIHGDKFGYPDGDYYINSDTLIKLFCKEHGEYFFTHPDSHIGKKQTGCPLKHESKGEEKTRKWLELHNLKYTKQKSFPDCKDKYRLRFDFEVVYNDETVLIEYNGIQHYMAFENGYWGGEEGFINRERRDNIKLQYCDDNDINLLIIRYDEDIIEVLTNYFT